MRGMGARVPTIRLGDFLLAPDAVALVPGELARSCRAIPVVIAGGTLVVAMQDVCDVTALRALERASGRSVQPLVAAAEDLSLALDTHYPIQA